MATVREQLQAVAESRAQQQGIPLEQTPEYQDLRTIANLADDQLLIKHTVVAPHPRCTLWFGERGYAKARAEVCAERNFYLPTGGQRPQDSERPALLTPSTYRLGGIAYVPLGEPGARTGD